MGYAPTYYPGTNDLGRAIPVELKAGEEVPGLDISLLSTRAVLVRGRILNPSTEKGKLRAWVVIMARESKVRSFSPTAQTNVDNPQGEFEIRGVVPGSYTLIANSWTGEEVYQARIPVEVGPSDIEGLIIPLGKGVEVSGRVRWEGGDQSTPDHKARVMLMPRDDMFMMRSAMREANPDGSIVLQNIAGGEYSLQIDGAPEDCYPRSALLGGEDVLADGVSITMGRVRGALEILMDCAGGILEGTVANDQLSPMPGASVVLVPETDRRGMPHLFKTTTTDQYGRFSIRGVAPGEYKAFAWQKLQSGAYQDPDFLRRYEDAGKPVSVGEGAKLVIQLRLILTDKSPR
ncbi:MAG: carboxypeptidase regulatory-like domain-containing protein [Acidobacteria bacterium]|nr:carboxypeptidase regulatory-like domain-containing protein [Acidobacteriota bacterium]